MAYHSVVALCTVLETLAITPEIMVENSNISYVKVPSRMPWLIYDFVFGL